MPFSGARILCVDGDEDTCLMEKLLFEQQGFEVILAKGLTEAIEIARRVNVHLYLIAQKLNDGTGIELCHRIREFDHRTPIIFWSAFVFERDRIAAIESGANVFLRKPDGFELLVETASRLLIKPAVTATAA